MTSNHSNPRLCNLTSTFGILASNSCAYEALLNIRKFGHLNLSRISDLVFRVCPNSRFLFFVFIRGSKKSARFPVARLKILTFRMG